MNLGHWKDGAHYYPFRIFYHHTDAGGIVYYARYFEMAEEARGAALASLDIGYPGGFDGDFVVRSVSAGYERSARLGDEMLVATRFMNPRGASITAVQRFYGSGDTAKAAIDMTTELAWFGERRRPARIPGKILEALG